MTASHPPASPPADPPPASEEHEGTDDLIQRRLAEAVDAYGDDLDGLHDEAKRIAAEAGLDPTSIQIEHIDTHTDPAEAIARLYEISSHLLAETASLRRDIDRLQDLASAAITIAATTGPKALKRYARHLYRTATSTATDSDREGDGEGEGSGR